jgi:hypothetical protein
MTTATTSGSVARKPRLLGLPRGASSACDVLAPRLRSRRRESPATSASAPVLLRLAPHKRRGGAARCAGVEVALLEVDAAIPA